MRPSTTYDEEIWKWGKYKADVKRHTYSLLRSTRSLVVTTNTIRPTNVPPIHSIRGLLHGCENLKDDEEEVDELRDICEGNVRCIEGGRTRMGARYAIEKQDGTRSGGIVIIIDCRRKGNLNI